MGMHFTAFAREILHSDDENNSPDGVVVVALAVTVTEGDGQFRIGGLQADGCGLKDHVDTKLTDYQNLSRVIVCLELRF